MARQNLFFCNGMRIKTILDLQQNFDAESVKHAFISGNFQQWLSENGYGEILAKIKTLDVSAPDFSRSVMIAIGITPEKLDSYLDRENDKNHKKLTISWTQGIFPKKYSKQFAVKCESVATGKLSFDFEEDELLFDKSELTVRDNTIFFSHGLFGIVLSKQESWGSLQYHVGKYFSSEDGFNWAEEPELSENEFCGEYFIHGSEHDFIFSSDSHKCLVYADNSWDLFCIDFKGFGVEGLVGSQGGAILSLFEQNDNFGVLYLKDDNSKGVVVGKPYFDGRDQQFIYFDIPPCTDNVFCFNQTLFILHKKMYDEDSPSFFRKARIHDTEFDDVSCGFIPDKLTVTNSLLFAFKEDDLFISRDGVCWEKSGLLTTGEVTVCQYKNYYLAFGTQRNSFTNYFFYSQDGKIWKKIDDKFGYINPFVAIGNNRIILCRGRHYFCGKIEEIE